MNDTEFDTLLHNVHINDERLRQAAVESYAHTNGRDRRSRLLAHPSAVASPTFLRYMTDQWLTDSRADKAEVYVSAIAGALLAQQSGDPISFHRDELIALSQYSPAERPTYGADHRSESAVRTQKVRAWNRAMVNTSTACPTELVDAIARLILPFEPKSPSPLVALPKDMGVHDTVERRQEFSLGMVFSHHRHIS
jgi:hypothetical protein